MHFYDSILPKINNHKPKIVLSVKAPICLVNYAVYGAQQKILLAHKLLDDNP